MDMSGEYRIPAPRDRVWAALNDPEILKQAIPGCDELTKHSDTELEAKVTAKVGPVKAKFGGNVRLENINAPVSYSIVGEGKGGAAGFAKGGADVHLKEDGADTILTYSARAEVGGKLAQIGSRLIQGTAKKMADDFFGKFSQIVTDGHAAAVGATAAAGEAAAAQPAAAAGPAPQPAAVTPPPAAPAAPPPVAADSVAPAGPAGDTAPPPPREPPPPPPAKEPAATAAAERTAPASRPAGADKASQGLFAGLGMPAYIGIGVVVLILLLLLFN